MGPATSAKLPGSDRARTAALLLIVFVQVLPPVSSHRFAQATSNRTLDWNFLNAYSTCKKTGASVPGAICTSSSLVSLDSSVTGAKWSPANGPIPTTLSLLTSLTFLKLSKLNITSIPPFISVVQKLKRLSLPNNALTSIPQGLFTLNNLAYLSLVHNSIAQSIPANITKLQALTAINLGYNKFSGGLPSLFLLPSLFKVYLTHNRFTSGIITSGRFYGDVLDIDLSFNLFNGTLPELTPPNPNFPFLEYLDLSNNPWQPGPIPTILGTWFFLSYLNLAKTNAIGSIPANLGQLVYAGHIDLSSNWLSGPAPFFNLSASNVVLSNNFLNAVPDCTNAILNCDTSCPHQKSPSQCAAFCGAGSSAGPCAGQGVCSFPKCPPLCFGSGTCNCTAGYKTPKGNPGTCVKA